MSLDVYLTRKKWTSYDAGETFNSDNGWGMYVNFVPFVEKYLNACKQYPDAKVEVWR